MKQGGKLLLIAALLAVAYKKRYRMLNIILSNRWIRAASINTAMKMPNVRDQFMNNLFRK